MRGFSDNFLSLQTNTTRMTERIIAQRLGISLPQVQGTVRLLREGATIPFISRYRKEATGSSKSTIDNAKVNLENLIRRFIDTNIEEMIKFSNNLIKIGRASCRERV